MIAVGDVLKFARGRVMVVLLLKENEHGSAKVPGFDCLMLDDSLTHADGPGFQVGHVISWPTSYLDDQREWRKV